MRRTLIVLIGIAALVATGVAAWIVLSPSDDTPSPAAAPGFAVTADDRSLGNSHAPVVLIEYAAPICPHCAAFNMENFPALKAAYIDSGKVFYIFRVYPLRPDDGPAE